MGLWKRSIQWQLILSMGAALLTSILIVVGVYSAVVNRLTERFLVEEALPARVLAIRNDLERVLTAPITANAGIAANTFIQDWLAALPGGRAYAAERHDHLDCCVGKRQLLHRRGPGPGNQP